MNFENIKKTQDEESYLEQFDQQYNQFAHKR